MNRRVTPELDLRPFGYAPGEYHFRCIDVDHVERGSEKNLGDDDFGDKRAYRCKTCAMRRLKEYVETVLSPKQKPVRAPQLTRDKCIQRHSDERCRPVDNATVIPMLLFKMHDEISEISRDLTNPEEYADLLESILALAKRNGVTFVDIKNAAAAKHEKKGGFDAGNFWIPKEFFDE